MSITDPLDGFLTNLMAIVIILFFVSFFSNLPLAPYFTTGKLYCLNVKTDVYPELSSFKIMMMPPSINYLNPLDKSEPAA